MVSPNAALLILSLIPYSWYYDFPTYARLRRNNPAKDDNSTASSMTDSPASSSTESTTVMEVTRAISETENFLKRYVDTEVDTVNHDFDDLKEQLDRIKHILMHEEVMEESSKFEKFSNPVAKSSSSSSSSSSALPPPSSGPPLSHRLPPGLPRSSSRLFPVLPAPIRFLIHSGHPPIF